MQTMGLVSRYFVVAAAAAAAAGDITVFRYVLPDLSLFSFAIGY